MINSDDDDDHMYYSNYLWDVYSFLDMILMIFYYSLAWSLIGLAMLDKILVTDFPLENIFFLQYCCSSFPHLIFGFKFFVDWLLTFDIPHCFHSN